jgi:hypothetical protein
MTGKQLRNAARDGDAAKFRKLLSTQGAHSFINDQGADGRTPLFFAAKSGLAAVKPRGISV